MSKLTGATVRVGVTPPVSTGFFWFLLSLVAAVAVFWFGLESLGQAWSTPEYSHGPLIPLLSGYMFLREMKMVPAVSHPVTDRGPGIAIVIAALLLALLGNLVRIPDIVTYALILWIWGLVLICFGWRRGIFFWPAVLHLVFMLPLPQFVYWQVTIFLQGVSSSLGVGLISSLGIPVFLDGNIIDLGYYKLQVAEACSGLRYLFPIMSFSYIFAVLYTGPRWHKIVLLLSAAPITVLMNSFRIGVIGVLVDNFGIAQAEGFLHAFEGWVIFVSCVGLLFLLAVVMQRLQRHPQPLADTLDLDFNGVHHQLARALAVVPSRALVIACLATGTLAAAWHLAPNRPPVEVAREPLVVFPKVIGDWQGRSTVLSPIIEQVLAADDYYVSTYVQQKGGPPVDFFVAYYASQTDGAGIHSPEVCIPAGGWEIATLDQVEVEVAGAGTIPLNRAIIQKGLERQLVYFWFEQRGRRLTSDYAAKAYTVWDALTIGRTDGALVRLITPIGSEESEAAAEARLGSFLAPMLARLPRFVPGAPGPS
ncbi:MAG: VPLPA-CTERM-specific exosortase XrtD [Pseudomonadota bacterium]